MYKCRISNFCSDMLCFLAAINIMNIPQTVFFLCTIFCVYRKFIWKGYIMKNNFRLSLTKHYLTHLFTN